MAKVYLAEYYKTIDKIANAMEILISVTHKTKTDKNVVICSSGLRNHVVFSIKMNLRHKDTISYQRIEL